MEISVDSLETPALTKAQLGQVKKSAPKAKGGTIRSSLFELENA